MAGAATVMARRSAGVCVPALLSEWRARVAGLRDSDLLRSVLYFPYGVVAIARRKVACDG